MIGMATAPEWKCAGCRERLDRRLRSAQFHGAKGRQILDVYRNELELIRADGSCPDADECEMSAVTELKFICPEGRDG